MTMDLHSSKRQNRRIGALLPQTRRCGFTLLELLITLTIAGILAAIVIPNYNRYLINTRRIEAIGLLYENAQYLERWFSLNNRYDRDMGGNNPTPLPMESRQSPRAASGVVVQARYTISLQAVSQNTYVLQAQPVENDVTCGTLRLDQTGARSNVLNGVQAFIPACWER